MEHLFNITVHHDRDDIDSVLGFKGGLGAMKADGLELMTGYEPVDGRFIGKAVSVHLPYAIDWYGPWSGERHADPLLDDMSVKYQHYGRTREEIVDSLYCAIKMAEPLSPAYGVIHASSANIEELLNYEYTDRDEDIVEAFADLMNEVVCKFPDGEPPFALAFENLWWPGLTMKDDSGYRILEEKLDFMDWGLCLDTGHLLVATKKSTDEETALKLLVSCADNYSEEMTSKIIAMHLHVNTTADFMRNCGLSESKSIPEPERIKRGYDYVSKMDSHKPFTVSPRSYVERISPDFLVHELCATGLADHIRDHMCQHSFFD